MNKIERNFFGNMYFNFLKYDIKVKVRELEAHVYVFDKRRDEWILPCNINYSVKNFLFSHAIEREWL